MHRKDSFTFLVQERTVAQVPQLSPTDKSAPITIDEAGYTAYLERKARLAPAKGVKRMTLTI